MNDNLSFYDERDAPRIDKAVEELGVGEELHVRVPLGEGRGTRLAGSIEYELGKNVTANVTSSGGEIGVNVRKVAA
jgi:hypothetical protein